MMIVACIKYWMSILTEHENGFVLLSRYSQSSLCTVHCAQWLELLVVGVTSILLQEWSKNLGWVTYHGGGGGGG